MNNFDLQVPFFLPVWRRTLLVGVCIFWSIIEFSSGASFWGATSGALAVYAIWQLFLREWPEDTAVHGDGKD